MVGEPLLMEFKLWYCVIVKLMSKATKVMKNWELFLSWELLVPLTLASREQARLRVLTMCILESICQLHIYSL